MELLDIYDNNGNVTGKTIVRGDSSVKLNYDEHIAVCVIYIENSKGEFLMQKTSLEKGGLYSSTGGHVCSGESPLDAIKREVFEELSVNIEKNEIKQLGFLLYDKPLRYMFYLKKDINVNEVILQKEEVEFVRYMSVSEINNLITEGKITESHGIIFEKILEYKRDIKHN